MAGCSIIAVAAALGVGFVVAIMMYFGTLGICLVLGIIFLVMSSIIMKIPEVRKKHKKLRIVLIILGIATIVFSVTTIIVSIISMSFVVGA